MNDDSTGLMDDLTDNTTSDTAETTIRILPPGDKDITETFQVVSTNLVSKSGKEQKIETEFVVSLKHLRSGDRMTLRFLNRESAERFFKGPITPGKTEAAVAFRFDQKTIDEFE